MGEKIETKVSVDEEIATFLKRCDDKGNNLLHYVVKTDNVEFAKHLIAAGCDVNKKNNENDPPLTIAIQENKLEMVKILLNAGADYENDHFHQKDGPLRIASYHGCLEIVQLLIDKGVNVNARTIFLGTALHCASTCRNVKKSDEYLMIMKALINACADINAEDDEGYTPLVHTIVSKFNEGRELLLSFGANSLKENKNFQFLRDVMLDYNDLDMLGQLFDFGADPDWIDEYNDSCLSFAAYLSMSEEIDVLVDKGAKIDKVNDEGIDPLCRALKLWPENYTDLHSSNDDHDKDIEGGENRKTYLYNIECLETLLKRGANVNHVTNDGMTPLYIVLNDYECQHSNFARILLKNGATFDFSHPIVHKVMNNTNGSKFPNLLLRHTAMFQAQDRADGPTNFDLNKLNKKSKKYYARCRDELESMKATKIEDTNVSFFNVLFDRNIGPYTHNENVKSAFEEPDITKCFPIYRGLLRERFSKEVKFQKLVRKAETSLCYIFNWDKNSTHLLLDNILRYLDEKDLVNLALI